MKYLILYDTMLHKNWPQVEFEGTYEDAKQFAYEKAVELHIAPYKTYLMEVA